METFQVTESQQRLDHYLKTITNLSRNEIKKQILEKNILVNKQQAKPSQSLNPGDTITIKQTPKKTKEIPAEPFDYQILYEDKDVIAINKPAGVVVHPGQDKQNLTGTVANAMKSIFQDTPEDPTRPGIVHRLDKDTSGILLLAKNNSALQNIKKQFKERSTQKTYLTVAYGHFKHPIGIINSPIGRDPQQRKQMAISNSGKEAITKYKVLKETTFQDIPVSLLKVQILTGRTHQIRVHLKALKHPVIGDNTYGKRSANKTFQEHFKATNQLLLAHKLRFTSPETKKEISITCQPPRIFQEIIDSVFKLKHL